MFDEIQQQGSKPQVRNQPFVCAEIAVAATSVSLPMQEIQS